MDSIFISGDASTTRAHYYLMLKLDPYTFLQPDHKRLSTFRSTQRNRLFSRYRTGTRMTKVHTSLIPTSKLNWARYLLIRSFNQRDSQLNNTIYRCLISWPTEETISHIIAISD